MTLASGSRLGPYQILGPLGAGGMGEVYRARDTRLDREVAVKTVSADVAADPERRSRFEREAKAIAALTHPHICTLYDVGNHEGIEFLVMELLAGETLAARLVKGPLEIAEALACAMQIADALDSAHRAGVVHRDLKPGNVMLTRSGASKSGAPHAKLLDFGLAKAAGPTKVGPYVRAELAPPSAPPDATPTLPVTAKGQILGTLPYMAPEQLDGTPVDARADLFAFGAIVFEMVTGRRAYGASSLAMPGTPPALERLVAVCLSKDPEDRWSSAHDVLLQLRPIAASPTPAVVDAKGKRREWIAWSAAAVAIVAALAIGAALIRAPRNQTDAGLDLLSMLPPDQTTLERGEAPQISPDGRRVAFVATDRVGRNGLYIRSRDSLIAQPLPDTDGASMPFWSPDSRQLGFFSQGQLKTIAIAGGSAHALAPAAVPNTICLTADEKRIVYDQIDPVSGNIDICSLNVGGDRPSRLIFDPAVDFYPVCSAFGQDIVFASLREGPPNVWRSMISAPGSETAVLQSPVPKIPTDLSRDGRLLVFTILNQKTNADIEVVPIAGGPPQIVAATATEERNAKLSPDGRWIAYNSNESGSFEVYVQPFPLTGAKWQVSKNGGQQPQWRRDGSELFYIAPDKKLIGVAVKTRDGFTVGEARALMDTRISAWERANNQGVQYAVTADGQRFLVNTASDATQPITLVLNWPATLTKGGTVATKKKPQRRSKRSRTKASARKSSRSSPRRHVPTRGLYGWVTHTELASADPLATKAWCAKVLGWTFKPSFPMPGGGEYHLFVYSDKGGGGIRPHNPPEVPGSIPYIHVADAQAAFELALREGAEEMLSPTPVMEGVIVAIVRAPGGVAIGFSGP